MSNCSWYEDAIIIDGLNASKNFPKVYESWRAGGLTAVHVTHCSPYLRLPDTMKSLAQWKRWFRDYAEMACNVRTVADIHAAKRERRIGVILGWQDAAGFDDHLYNIQLYHELGVRFVQITYNTANGIGTGCYDTLDAGLTDFGCEVVQEMNRVGIAVDLSHCSEKSATDAIRVATRPVCYTHIAPLGLYDTERNKSDNALRRMADHGGFVGVALHPFMLRKGNDSELDDYIDAIEYVANLVGEDLVGIGTDYFEGVDPAMFKQTMTRRDRYHARELGRHPVPAGLRYPSEMPSIAKLRSIVPALEKRGWTQTRMEKLLGGNFVRYVCAAWAA